MNNIAKILIELENTPFEGIGKPEALKYELTGFWSRRINQKDRIVY
ncbi:MAG: Txe/YoeB family addiction module toxin [Flavobacterium sp.]|nr:Txe/YoeB family addiction module toxin [Flavobacterium sp.]